MQREHPQTSFWRGLCSCLLYFQRCILMTFYPLQFSTVPSPSSVPPLGPSCARRGDASVRCFVSAAAGAAARSGSGLSLTHRQMWPGVCAAPAACCFVLLAVLLCFIQLRTDVDVVKGTEGFPSSDDSDSKVFPGSILFCTGTRVLLREIQKNPSPVSSPSDPLRSRPSASGLIARRTRRANASRPPVNCDEVCQ